MRPPRTEWALTATAVAALATALESVAIVACESTPRLELGRVISDLRRVRDAVAELVEFVNTSEDCEMP